MNRIQLILITGLVFIGAYFIVRLRKRILDIVILLGMIIGGIVLVIWPDITNQLAADIGVGRGADMIFYLSILIFWFIIMKLYVKIRKLEQQFTELVRNQALQQAKDLSEMEP